ncbi:MAG TPA: biotin/lipoyl-containing protein [Blastocatellia bacterium]|jgi:biotin carboxyl carrier protein|nr:biotin/lipoyl-containing protein [Blastocatellia bacterium]
MKIELEINGQLIEGAFTLADGSARLTFGGATREAQVSEPEPGIFTVIIDDRVYRCALEESPGGAIEVIVNGERIPVAARDKKHLRGQAGAGAGASGQVKLSSPMPGKVVRVLLSAGDEVAARQGVLVVEAMKMQNEVQSPKAGKIAEINVSEGQTVNAGEVLAVIE